MLVQAYCILHHRAGNQLGGRHQATVGGLPPNLDQCVWFPAENRITRVNLRSCHKSETAPSDATLPLARVGVLFTACKARKPEFIYLEFVWNHWAAGGAQTRRRKNHFVTKFRAM